MKTIYLYNTAHPMAESGKPIFIPFGEWDYDGRSRQRLDRAHGERIANELNAKVAKGEPGIPVYQGHPDVPELAAKYPDKGALGWVTKIELANEDGRDGLALTVEWDRDPGRGFRWFSPYWLANSHEGATYIVDEISSIGLVNRPNIPEFRLANEETTMKTYKLPPKIVELAARRDAACRRMANVIDANGMGHSDENGQFDGSGSGEGKGAGAAKQSKSPRFGTRAYKKEEEDRRARIDKLLGDAESDLARTKAKRAADRAEREKERKARHDALEARIAEIRKRTAELKEFNDRTAARLKQIANEAGFDESKHPRAADGKFSSGGGGGGGAASGKSPSPELKAKADAARAKAGTISPSARKWASDKIFLGAKDITHEGLAKRINSAKAQNHASREDKSVRVERLRALHAKAISLGFKYDTSTGSYE